MLDLEAFLADSKESPPCGPNLEHDLAFFELEDTARGKSEQRVGDAVKPGEDPNWPKVAELAQGLLLRSKDLRVAVHLTRALTRTEGIPGLANAIDLINGLLQRHWDRLYPLLEAERGNDPTERLNALAPLADPESVLGDLRHVNVVNSREHGQLQAREVEIALGRLAAPPRATNASAPKTLVQIHAQMAAAFTDDRTVPTALREARDRVFAIQTLMVERVGGDGAVDLKPLVQCLESLLEACDGALGVPAVAGRDTLASEAGAGVGRHGIPGEIATREDAVHALDLVCSYLERHEPSNPAPLFIRRAQRLMTKNFVEIVKDLLPDSLSNLERLAGSELEKKK
jgi:type VI secretion system protein ImpA